MKRFLLLYILFCSIDSIIAMYVPDTESAQLLTREDKNPLTVFRDDQSSTTVTITTFDNKYAWHVNPALTKRCKALIYSGVNKENNFCLPPTVSYLQFDCLRKLLYQIVSENESDVYTHYSPTDLASLLHAANCLEETEVVDKASACLAKQLVDHEHDLFYPHVSKEVQTLVPDLQRLIMHGLLPRTVASYWLSRISSTCVPVENIKQSPSSGKSLLSAGPYEHSFYFLNSQSRFIFVSPNGIQNIQVPQCSLPWKDKKPIFDGNFLFLTTLNNETLCYQLDKGQQDISFIAKKGFHLGFDDPAYHCQTQSLFYWSENMYHSDYCAIYRYDLSTNQTTQGDILVRRPQWAQFSECGRFLSISLEKQNANEITSYKIYDLVKRISIGSVTADHWTRVIDYSKNGKLIALATPDNKICLKRTDSPHQIIFNIKPLKLMPHKSIRLLKFNQQNNVLGIIADSATNNTSAYLYVINIEQSPVSQIPSHIIEVPLRVTNLCFDNANDKIYISAYLPEDTQSEKLIEQLYEVTLPNPRQEEGFLHSLDCKKTELLYAVHKSMQTMTPLNLNKYPYLQDALNALSPDLQKALCADDAIQQSSLFLRALNAMQSWWYPPAAATNPDI